MCLDYLNWVLWVRFHGRFWYQSFIDGSNIWVDPWGPEMDHSLLGRSYLVVVPSYDKSCALGFLTGLYGLDFMADIDVNPSSMSLIFGVWIGLILEVSKWPSAIGPQLFGSYVMYLDSLNWALRVRFHGRYWDQSFIDGSNIWGVDRTDPWGTKMGHPPLGRSYLVAMPSHDMSCALILLTGLYGWDCMAYIDINPSSMGPIFGVWIGPTLGVPKWTIRRWAGRSYLVIEASFYMALIIVTCITFMGRLLLSSMLQQNLAGCSKY